MCCGHLHIVVVCIFVYRKFPFVIHYGYTSYALRVRSCFASSMTAIRMSNVADEAILRAGSNER